MAPSSTAEAKRTKPRLTRGMKARRLRLRRGLSVTEVSERTGIGVGALWEFEHGVRTNVKLAMIERLCLLYGVTSRSLLDF